ncbi:MAG: ABC transporter substrate-binding protein [Desulfarculus sp.]|nr:ABC transporter substrate-binding protein [Desulfarculus sp.]
MTQLVRKAARWLALACLALAPAVPALAAAEEPILVGANLSMTGQVAAFSQMTWDGIRIAQQMRPTALGRPLKLMLVDNKSDNVEAANATNRLVTKDKVAAMLGPVTSSATLAAAPIAEAARVPLVSPSATSPIVTQGRRYVFRVCFMDPFQGQAAARHAFQNLGARRAAVLIDVGQDYAVGLAAFFKREFQRLGGQVVAEAKCGTGDQDFSAQLGAIKASNPDLLYLPNYYAEIALAARQARELGLRTPLLSGDGADAPELLNIGGPAVEGLSFTTHFHRQGAVTPLAREFLAGYAKERAAGNIKEDLTSFHVLGAEAYLVLADALERAGGIDGPQLRQALAGTRDFLGISGRLTIGEDGNAVKSAAILQVKDGKFEYVTTIEP